jgi:MFS family permease
MVQTAGRVEGAVRRPNRWVVLAICSMSLFVVGLDTTIVNVALPAIGHGLQVGTRGLEWAVDAYTIALATLLISSGALADRIGRRRVFRLGLVVFGAASVACSLAPSIDVLIAARVAQGVGGSMLVGGALVSAVGWRSVFSVGVPIIVVVLLLTSAFVPESRAPQPRSLDGMGQLLLAVVVGGSVALLIEGPRIGWASAGAVIGYAVVAAAVAGFVRTESRRREPLMNLQLFQRKPFTAAVVGAVVVFIALNMTLLLGTLYLQHARGMTPAAAGMITLPMAVAATLCAPLSGLLVGRTGPRLPLLLAGGNITLGALCLITLHDHTGIPVLLLAYLFVGVGIGFANAPITNTAVSGLPAAQAGLAGAITSTARQVGAALGVAVAGGIIADTAPANLAQASRPAWLIVAACGLLLLLVAGASPDRR